MVGKLKSPVSSFVDLVFHILRSFQRPTDQGKTVTVTITDRCTGCALTSLDFSPAAFDELADPSVGRLYGIEWEWV